ncbi:MAG: alpha/beta hydrolase [Cytophagales bacterium]|nr:MAG: alpha/beta hydrolase [Cytophagales bacterium]
MQTLQDWEKQGRFFSYRSHRIFYQYETTQTNTDEILLCIHGYPTASWDWVKMWQSLTTHFQVVAPDMIGFGFSDKPLSYPYHIIDQAELHEQLLHHLGIKKVHILAHDYGDTVAQELLARYEDRQKNKQEGINIQSIAFLNGGLFPETHRARFAQKLLLSPIGSWVARLFTEKRFRATFKGIFGAQTSPTEQEYKDFWYLATREGGKKIQHKLIRYMEDRRQNRARWVGALQSTQVPLCVIDGADDPVSGAHMVDRYRELVPNPNTVLLKGIGHYPQVEAPELVWNAFWQFIAPLSEKKL